MKRPSQRQERTIPPKTVELPTPGGVSATGVLAHDDFDRDVWCVLGMPVDRIALGEAVVLIERAIRDKKRLSFVTPNVNWLVRAVKEPEARRQIVDADLSLADGAPIVALARLLGVPLKERAAGSDLFDALRARPGFRGRRMRVFFFGGRSGAAEEACARLNDERGGVEGVGWLNPGFGEVEAMSAPQAIDAVNRADPDFVVVSLGAAKGQSWIDRNQSRLSAPVIAHLGAVVDFTAGSIRRAPPLVSRLGLEWVFRIVAEPALWRRYARDGVSLAGLLVSRLLPQLRIARTPRAPRPASANVGWGPAGARICLQGDIVAPRLDPIRAAFREAAAGGADVTLVLSQAGAMDRAFLGLVLMLEKHLTRSGRRLSVAGLNRRSRALFRANAMNYAEVATGADSAADAGAAALAT